MRHFSLSQRLAAVVVVISSMCSCASMLPVTGAMLGGAGGALGGPVTAGLGAGAGYAFGDMAQHSLDDSDTESDIDAIRTHVEAITTGDVEQLLATRMGEERGFLDKTLQSLYALLKFAGIVIALLLVLPLAYSWYRKKKATPFYEAQEKLKEEFDEVKRKVLGG